MSVHLVVVDLQEIFADPKSEWHTPGLPEILSSIDQLVKAFSPRVAFTRFVAPLSPKGAWKAYYERFPAALRPATSPLYQLVDRYVTTAGETLDTTTFSKWGFALAERIGRADTVVLAGVSTDCCILSTALAAADAGVKVIVAADACAAANGETHERALEVMATYAPLIEIKASSEAAALAEDWPAL